MKNVSQDIISLEETAEAEYIELYHIWQAGGLEKETHWYLTNADTKITYNSFEWNPCQIGRKAFASGENSPKTNQISLIPPDTILRDYVLTLPPSNMKVMIYQYYPTIMQAYVLFAGAMSTGGFQGETCNIAVSDFSFLFNQLIPNDSYQRTCNNTIYDDRCLLDRDDFKSVRTVQSLNADKDIITLSTVIDDETYNRGYIYDPLHESKRFITSNTTTVITVRPPFIFLEVGDEIDIYEGCDGTRETCQAKGVSGNLENFTGYAHIISEKNPATQTS